MAEEPAGVSGKKILLGVSGGIAAYKVVQVARDLSQLGADVRVVMTPSAERFVGAQTFAALTGNPVATKLFSAGADVPHVELARGADLAVLAPATANSMAKLVAGLADDLLSSTFLTVTCPIMVVPAMHTEMWESAATTDNVGTLKERGVHIVGPASGALSSGDEGLGRMVEPGDIVRAVAEVLGHSADLAGRTILVTAGGTREPIDPVRYIGNHSSGRMGYVLAEEAARRGAKVMLVSGATNLVPPPGVDVVPAHTADEMREAVLAHSADVDVIVKAAAVADFKPDRTVSDKLKKSAGAPEVRLLPTPDILRELGSDPSLRKPGSVLVGFAAETEASMERLTELAEHKRVDKGADLIVANQVGVADSGFEVPTNRVVIAGPDGPEVVGLTSKPRIARLLLDRVARLLADR